MKISNAFSNKVKEHRNEHLIQSLFFQKHRLIDMASYIETIDDDVCDQLMSDDETTCYESINEAISIMIDGLNDEIDNAMANE